MRIPKSFKLGGRTIRVVYEDIGDKDSISGLAQIRNSKLILDSTKNSSKDYLEKVFFHELVHYLLFSIGERELSENERLVDSLANVMHQVMTTMEYK